jgi:putative polyhydroxyalkanoate system protein
MADIKTSRKHSLNESELRARLENLAAQMRKKFGIQCDFQGNVVHLSGDTVKSGMVTWTSDSLAIELTLGLMGKMFKRQIQKEIEKHIDAIVVV